MSMTEFDALRVASERAHLAAKATSPVVSIHDVDLRTLEGDFRAMTTIEEAEKRAGITRTADASSGPWKYQARKAKQPLCAGWWMMPVAIVGGAAWAGLFKWLGWW